MQGLLKCIYKTHKPPCYIQWLINDQGHKNFVLLTHIFFNIKILCSKYWLNASSVNFLRNKFVFRVAMHFSLMLLRVLLFPWALKWNFSLFLSKVIKNYELEKIFAYWHNWWEALHWLKNFMQSTKKIFAFVVIQFEKLNRLF